MLLFQLGICIFGCGSLEKMTRISLRTGSGLLLNSKCVQYFYCTRSCIIKALYVYRVAAPRSHYRSNICSAVQLTRTENRVTGSSHISIFISSHQPSNQHVLLVAKVQFCLDNNTKLWKTWQPGMRGKQANMCLTNVCLIIPCMQP